MGKTGTWYLCVGAVILAAAFRIPYAEAHEGDGEGSCEKACDIGPRGGVNSSIPDTGIVQNLQGGKNRGSLDHTTTATGYEMTIFGSSVGGAGPISDKYTAPISGSTDETTSVVVIKQEVTLSLNTDVPPTAPATATAWTTLDHKLETVINGIREKDDKLLVIMANGKAVGRNAVGRSVPGLDGTQIDVNATFQTETFIGDCVAFSGTATVTARLHLHVVALTPGISSVDAIASATDLQCELK
jgi:hypothetical protein